MGSQLAAPERPLEAVGWQVRAFAIRLRLDVPQQRIDRRALRGLRDSVGMEAFCGAVAAVLDKESTHRRPRRLR
jgi:hypothetical protein